MASSQHFEVFQSLINRRTPPSPAQHSRPSSILASDPASDERHARHDRLSSTSSSSDYEYIPRVPKRGVRWAVPGTPSLYSDGRIEDSDVFVPTQGLQTLIDETRVKGGFRPLVNSPPNKKPVSLQFESSFVPLLLIFPQLSLALSGTEVDDDTKKDIKYLMDWVFTMLVPSRDFDRPPSFNTAVEEQEEILKTGRVAFKDLHRLYVPGDLIYTRNRTDMGSLAYEQCWITQRCNFFNVPEGTYLGVLALELTWSSEISKLVVNSSLILIEEYPDEKPIDVQAFSVVPLKSLPATERDELVKRLTARGKSYAEICHKSPSSTIWDYHGPSLRFFSDEETFCVSDRWRPWDRQISGRVLLHENLTHTSSHTVPAPSLCAEVTDVLTVHTYLICPGRVLIRTLPDLVEESIFCDLLRPIEWNSSALNASHVLAADKILGMVRNFSPGVESTNQSPDTSPPKRLIVVLRGKESEFEDVLNAVAESAQRAFIFVDILDHITADRHPLYESDFVTHQAELSSAVLGLQNLGPLVAKRSFDQPDRCAHINKCRQILEKFSGIAFICLGDEDEMDPSFERLGLVHLRLDESPAA